MVGKSAQRGRCAVTLLRIGVQPPFALPPDMAFVGHDWNAYIELVFDLEEHPPYAIGNRYEHLAIEADGPLEPYIAALKSHGVKIIKDVYKSPSGTRAIAFIEDPNGIPVEVLEPRSREKLS